MFQVCRAKTLASPLSAN